MMYGRQQTSGFLKFSDHDEATRVPHLTVGDFDVLSERIGEARRNFSREIQCAVDAFDEYVSSFLWSIVDDVLDEESECASNPCFLYFIENADRDLVKIGISVNPNGRLKQLNTACGDNCILVRTFEFPSREDARSAESNLHRYYSHYRKAVHGRNKPTEWFDGIIRENRTFCGVPLYSLQSTNDIIELFKEDK